MLLGTAANLVFVLIALGIVYGIGALLSAPAVWLVAPLLAAGAYVLVEAAELAVAGRCRSLAISTTGPPG